MNEIQYITMTDASHTDAVVAMMNGLYAEDPAASKPDQSKFPETIRFLLARPEMGRIVLFSDGQSVHGYSILIPFWSNEYGGVILFVDELYVVAPSRRRGIGRGLFDFIARERPFDAVAVFLEVSPTNQRARRLYGSLGFVERQNSLLACRLPAQIP
jgi:ribosomal protein S18 acetylase RimI-like enzyme